MDVSRCPSGVGRDAGASAPAPDGLATGVGDENGLLRNKIAALREANLLLRIENSDLKVANGSLAEEKQALLAAPAEQVSEYQRSLGWMMIQKARNARRRLFREGRLSGRCWNAFSRFVRVAVTAGPGEATKKAVKKIARKLARSQSIHWCRFLFLVNRMDTEYPLPRPY